MTVSSGSKILVCHSQTRSARAQVLSGREHTHLQCRWVQASFQHMLKMLTRTKMLQFLHLAQVRTCNSEQAQLQAVVCEDKADNKFTVTVRALSWQQAVLPLTAGWFRNTTHPVNGMTFLRLLQQTVSAAHRATVSQWLKL